MTNSGISFIGNFARVYSLAPALEVAIHAKSEKNIEKSAAELESLMKKMILEGRCGLAQNGSLTLLLKGGSTPLKDNGHLVRGISSEKVDASVVKGGTTHTVTAYFVGIKRTAGLKMSSSHLGTYVPVSLYTLARNQVRGYTVTLPRTGIKKKVPKRDFRGPVRDAYKEQFKENMTDAVAKAVKELGAPL